jgi:nitrous oxide reductase accessory protein NosL
MVLSDRSYGAEFVSDQGKVVKFDELGELAIWLAANPAKGQAYVTNGVDGSLVPAETATYLYSPDLNGPMGGSTMTFADRKAAEAFAASQKLKKVQWLSYEVASKTELAASASGGHHGGH